MDKHEKDARDRCIKIVKEIAAAIRADEHTPESYTIGSEFFTVDGQMIGFRITPEFDNPFGMFARRGDRELRRIRIIVGPYRRTKTYFVKKSGVYAKSAIVDRLITLASEANTTANQETTERETEQRSKTLAAKINRLLKAPLDIRAEGTKHGLRVQIDYDLTEEQASKLLSYAMQVVLGLP